MACLELQGTKLTFSVLPTKDMFWAKTEIAIENEYVHYHTIDEVFTREELEVFLISMFRLLAGAYARTYNLAFEKAGVVVDLYAPTANGRELSREERRQNDCRMLLQMLLKSSDKKSSLGGVYSFVLHKKDIELFANALSEEFINAFPKEKETGKYLYVGVSPKGYKGCNYWYLDKSKDICAGDFVWVRMGRRQIEQVVYVDNVRYFDDDTAPYPPETVKQVLRKATEEEIAEARVLWAEEK